MDLIQWLEEWYQSMCDGEWEHCYGVKIDTLDNPGWVVTIDIEDTPLEEKVFNSISNNIHENDWMFCQIKDKQFIGSGDSEKLCPIIKIFKNWVES